MSSRGLDKTAQSRHFANIHYQVTQMHELVFKVLPRVMSVFSPFTPFNGALPIVLSHLRGGRRFRHTSSATAS